MYAGLTSHRALHRAHRGVSTLHANLGLHINFTAHFETGSLEV